MSRKCIWLVVWAVMVVCFAGMAHGQSVNVNFQQPASETPEGYLPDGGEVFADHGNGWSYGWDRDITGDARDRNNADSEDQRWDTLNHLQKASPPAIWEIELENALYSVYLVCGDPSNTDQTNAMDVEGIILEDPDGQDNFDEYEVTVEVTDGRLTITASADDGASNAKISFVDIVLAVATESARSPSPAKGATDVPRDLVMSWEPGEGVSAHDVYLGASFDDVNNASRANPMDVLLSQGQSDLTFDTTRLEFGQIYYWRIDEVLAAGGIYKGEVWSFTIEPFAYAVEGIIATASTTSDSDAGPEKTVDGSGLNEADEHSTVNADMWHGLPVGDDPIWLQYDLGKVYKLLEMQIWNYNVQFEPVLGFGLKDVTIEYSTDAVAWTVLGDVVLAQATAQADYVANTIVDFGGQPVRFVKIAVNSNYSGLSQYGLSEVRFLQFPAMAREPQPAMDATGVTVDSTLSWRAGREAGSHDVYLGTDELVLIDTVDDASFAPGGLDFGTAYLWRIDEVNDAEAIGVWEGGVWSFTTQEYAAIDDFESYTDDEGTRIYETWIDGYDIDDNGSTVGHLGAPFAEMTIVHSGSQSMPLFYDNASGATLSEAMADLGGLNLAANGAENLRLFFRGNPVDFLERADGSIVIGAAGADIWDTADECRFVYQTLNGDGEIVARVDSIENVVSAWTKDGVMIRESTDAGARNAFMAMTGGEGGGATWQQRLANNVDSQSSDTLPGNPFTTPYYVRVTRVGNDFSGFISPDGATWQQAGETVTVEMASTVLIGLAATSHESDNPVAVNFSEVAITGAVTGGWTVATLGVEMPSNDIEPLYVALEDTTGSVQVITHPDTAAVGAASWTEWIIPLSDLTAVNEGRIGTMYIGIGDRNNPSAGGTGVVYIDDIGYGRPVPEPVSEPSYIYDGEALDDAWDHDNGSDQWDGTGPGEGRPGGIAALTEDDVTFLRIQDTGDPRDYDLGDPGSNRKLYLTHLTDADLDGMRLEFRIRVATTAPVDDQHPDGGAGIEAWPADGIGYHIRDDGTGMIGIAVADLGIISFSLAKAGEPGFEEMTTDVLVMNNLVGNTPSGDVDTDAADENVTARNWVAVDDATQWHTFTVDIAAGGMGTHVVSVSVDGAPAEVFDVTVGTKLEADGSFLAMGSSGTGGITAFDVDYVSYVLPENQ